MLLSQSMVDFCSPVDRLQSTESGRFGDLGGIANHQLTIK